NNITEPSGMQSLSLHDALPIFHEIPLHVGYARNVILSEPALRSQPDSSSDRFFAAATARSTIPWNPSDCSTPSAARVVPPGEHTRLVQASGVSAEVSSSLSEPFAVCTARA